jgi:hypothetical protein
VLPCAKRIDYSRFGSLRGISFTVRRERRERFDDSASRNGRQARARDQRCNCLGNRPPPHASGSRPANDDGD